MAVAGFALRRGTPRAHTLTQLGQLAPERVQLSQAAIDLAQALIDHPRHVTARRLVAVAERERLLDDREEVLLARDSAQRPWLAEEAGEPYRHAGVLDRPRKESHGIDGVCSPR